MAPRRNDNKHLAALLRDKLGVEFSNPRATSWTAKNVHSTRSNLKPSKHFEIFDKRGSHRLLRPEILASGQRDTITSLEQEFGPLFYTDNIQKYPPNADPIVHVAGRLAAKTWADFSNHGAASHFCPVSLQFRNRFLVPRNDFIIDEAQIIPKKKNKRGIPSQENVTVYLIESKSSSYLGATYIGITARLQNRLFEHNEQIGEKRRGAKATELARPWKFSIGIRGFPDRAAGQEFEGAWQRRQEVSSEFCKHGADYVSGVEGKMLHLIALLSSSECFEICRGNALTLLFGTKETMKAFNRLCQKEALASNFVVEVNHRVMETSDILPI